MNDLLALQKALFEDPGDRSSELALADLLEEQGARIESIARLRLPKLVVVNVGEWQVYRYNSYPHDGLPGFSVCKYGDNHRDDVYLDWIEKRGVWTHGNLGPDTEALECPQEAYEALAIALSQVND